MTVATDNNDVTMQTPKETEHGPGSRAQILINKIDPETGERKDQPPSDPPPSVPLETITSHAFTLRKIVCSNPEENEGEIEFIDRHLWDLLKDLLRHYPYHMFQGPRNTLSSPYEPLILHWDKLKKATKEGIKNEDDKQARSDLELLLDTLSSSSGDPKLDKYFKTRDSNKEQRAITFEGLWTIFPPGSLIYGQPFQGQHQVFVVLDNMQPWPFIRRSSTRAQHPWYLLCWTYDWDGTKFRRLCLKLRFEYFEGLKPITSLPFCPFEHHEKHDDIRKDLIARGREYRRLCTARQSSQMFEYNGEATFVKKGFSEALGDGDEVGRRDSARVNTEDLD